MNNKLKQKLIETANKSFANEDASHDIDHTMRVLNNALYICKHEGGDKDIIIPAALFHDIIVYPKNCPRSKNEELESAELAMKILENTEGYPKEKIPHVTKAIKEHRFSKGIKPDEIESKILQDADRLECLGAIAVMRTFASCGQMSTKLFNRADPFCKNRQPADKEFALDLFFSRLMMIEKTMNTKFGKTLAMQRTKFLHDFVGQLRKEVYEDEKK